MYLYSCTHSCSSSPVSALFASPSGKKSWKIVPFFLLSGTANNVSGPLLVILQHRNDFSNLSSSHSFSIQTSKEFKNTSPHFIQKLPLCAYPSSERRILFYRNTGRPLASAIAKRDTFFNAIQIGWSSCPSPTNTSTSSCTPTSSITIYRATCTHPSNWFAKVKPVLGTA